MILTLWKKESGNSLTHRSGLTEEQIKALHELKPGDRLMLKPNRIQNKRQSDPDFFIVKFEKKEEF